MKNPLVTIITATTGSEFLTKNIDSVLNQTYQNFQHLVVVDGPGHLKKEQFAKIHHKQLDIIELPYPTGEDNFLCHRIYGGSTFFAKGDFICFLDEDNWMDPDHISSLLNLTSTSTSTYHWAYSLRKIVDQDSSFVCEDNCESLGRWPSIINEKDFLIDTNCFFLPKKLALSISPFWHTKARQRNSIDADRLVTLTLKDLELKKVSYATTGQYTINYRLSARSDAPKQKEFFLKGNELMKDKWADVFPWTKKL